MTESFVWHLGHGSISTGTLGSPAGNGGGPEFGATGCGVGGCWTGGSGGGAVASAGSGAGMMNAAPHFGHFPDLPALASSTENVDEQPGHANRIIDSSGVREWLDAGHAMRHEATCRVINFRELCKAVKCRRTLEDFETEIFAQGIDSGIVRQSE